jgi:hypothetical protein
MNITQIRRRLKSVSPQVLLFLLALAFTGAQGGVFHTTFNNFLADTYDISAGTRGLLEFPRELPGLLVTLFAGLLAFLPETRVGGIALFCTGIGLLGLGSVGFIEQTAIGWPLMIGFMFIWSVGNHLIMPVRESVGMSLGDETRRGRKLGQVRTFGAFGAILGAGAVWLITDVLKVPSHQLTLTGQPMPAYWLVFPCGALFGLIAAVLFMRIRDVGLQTKRSRLIIRRRYWLYYVLSALFGARKQIFITFAPWVLVRVFGQPPATFAKLWIVSALCSIAFIPTIGNLIDRFGERAVLIVDSFAIICVCMVYGFAYHWGTYGLWLTFICYILDQLLFAVGMARSTYMSKIATDPDHIPASVSMGVTLDHVMGMSVPTLGGFIWMAYGHEWVFVGAAGIALLMCLSAARIRIPSSATAQ